MSQRSVGLGPLDHLRCDKDLSQFRCHSLPDSGIDTARGSRMVREQSGLSGLEW